jgi:hypothetical protein
MSDDNLIIIGLIVKIFILVFLFASGAVFIHYGNKIKDGKITSDDKKAGEFILAFGVIGLFFNIISSIMLGYYWDSLLAEQNYIYIVLYIIATLFTGASNVILIIYGLKMHQTNICTNVQCTATRCLDDFQIAKFIVALGSICIIFSTLVIFFLIYNIAFKKRQLIELIKKDSLINNQIAEKSTDNSKTSYEKTTDEIV